MIDLTGVSCSYPDCEALSGIDLHIGRGESVAVIGPNGSGKSTLLKLLNGLLFAGRGTYLFDGSEITSKALRDQGFAKGFHRRIGLLFQNPDAQLFCPAVAEEIAFGPRQMGLEEAEVAARVSDCLALLDIAHLASRPPYHLSEGEKRKVALAAVLALNPEVLVLDEPMSGLDPKSKRFMRRMVGSLHASGKTVICSTHDFRYVEGLFARAVVLSEDHRLVRDDEYGRVLEDSEFLGAHNIL